MENTTDKIWFYLNPDTEEPMGPISTQELQSLLKLKKIEKRTLVWKEGMENWESISLVPAFAKTEILKLHVDPQPVRKHAI